LVTYFEFMFLTHKKTQEEEERGIGKSEEK
jgi:hypothetical protein